MIGHHTLPAFSAVTMAFCLSLQAQTMSITGRVIDAQSRPIGGAAVKFNGAAPQTVSGQDGRFLLTAGDGSRAAIPGRLRQNPVVKNQRIYFSVPRSGRPVSIELLSLSGSRLGGYESSGLESGSYALSLAGIAPPAMGTGARLVRITVDESKSVLSYRQTRAAAGFPAPVPILLAGDAGSGTLGKASAGSDSVSLSAVGYLAKTVAVPSLTADLGDIVLAKNARITIAYRMGLPGLESAISAIDSSLLALGLLTEHHDLSSRTGAEDITLIASAADIPGVQADPAVKKSGFQIVNNLGAVSVRAVDTTGAMYGAFEVAEQIGMHGGTAAVEAKTENPALPFRAIKFNLPWSPYWQEKITSTHTNTCRDTLFWKRFLDMMARNRYNALTLWNLHPYTYMIRPTNFPKACSFTDAELADWQRFWHTLFRMAKDRGIETYLVNWNVFVSRGFKANYDAKATSEDEFINGPGYTTEQIKQYTRECIVQTLNEYPELTGLGTSLGERMVGLSGQQIEDWISSVYFTAINQVKRPVKFIHRDPFQLADIQAMRNALDGSALIKPVYVELKFNHSHGMSSPGLFRTHGGVVTNYNSNLWIPEPVSYKMTWMIRNEDVLFLRWGEPSFIRQHIAINSKSYAAGYYIGSETHIPADDYFHVRNSDHIAWKYAFERQWLYYMTWGRLLYDPNTPDAAFAAAFDRRYPGKHGAQLLQAFQAASRMPLRFATLFEGTWDKSLYAEGFATSGFLDVNAMIGFQPLDRNLLRISDYVDALVAKKAIGAAVPTPAKMADSLEADGTLALNLANGIAATGPLACEIADIKALANLSLYFSEKIRGGIELQLFRKGQGKAHQDAAVAHLLTAQQRWADLVAITSAHYQKSELVHFNGGSFLWSDFTGKVGNDVVIARGG